MAKILRFVYFAVLFIIVSQNGSYAQKLIQNEGFGYIPMYQGKAVLIKEIKLKNVSVAAESYNRLKEWIKQNYTHDLVNTGIVYYNDQQKVVVKSKVELLLELLNIENVAEKAVMNYQLSAFIRDGKCIFEITDITYKIRNAMPSIKKRITAENFITKEALLTKDNYSKEKQETLKGTLFYFNNLAKSLEDVLNKGL